MSNRDDYIEKMKLQLDELNTKMSELEAKAKEAKADAREKYAEEMGKLRQQSQRALTKLEDVRVAGEDSWDAMVAEMEKFATPSFIPSSTSSRSSKLNARTDERKPISSQRAP